MIKFYNLGARSRSEIYPVVAEQCSTDYMASSYSVNPSVQFNMESLWG